MLRQYFEKKRKKKTASIFFFHIFERVAISRYLYKSLSYAKSAKRENFVFETGSIIPDTTNKKFARTFPPGVRVEWSVSGGSKLRGSGSNNGAERRCGRSGGRARCRHVSNKKSIPCSKKRKQFQIRQGQRICTIVPRLNSLANRKKKKRVKLLDRKKKERKSNNDINITQRVESSRIEL